MSASKTVSSRFFVENTKFINIYFNVLAKLERKLKEMTKNGNPTFGEVLIGRKKAPSKYPAAKIYPDPIPMRAATTQYTERSMVFTVNILGKKAVIREGFEEAVRLAWDVGEMLENDRSFENAVDRLEVTLLTPEVELPRVLERHEASLQVVFYKIC